MRACRSAYIYFKKRCKLPVNNEKQLCFIGIFIVISYLFFECDKDLKNRNLLENLWGEVWYNYIVLFIIILNLNKKIWVATKNIKNLIYSDHKYDKCYILKLLWLYIYKCPVNKSQVQQKISQWIQELLKLSCLNSFNVTMSVEKSMNNHFEHLINLPWC